MEFDDYVVQHRRALLRFAAVLTVDPATADDVVAEVLARAFENWSTVSRAASVHAYVRKMVLNEYLGSRRSAQRVTPIADVSDLHRAPTSADHAPVQDERMRLVGELRRLPAKQRAAVVLRYYEGRSFAEIAALLGTGENAVRSNISRGLRALRVQLTDDLEGAEPDPAAARVPVPARPTHAVEAHR